MGLLLILERGCSAVLIFALLAAHGAQGQTAGGRSSGGNSYQDMKLGLFVHYMNPAKEYRWGSTQWADGSQVQSLGELADNFDADDLAKTAASMGVQYVIFTTWHANMNVLYPSKVMKKWLPGHCTERDVIRDLISALKARKIKLILYVHPSDGHDFTKEDQERSGWADAARERMETPYPATTWMMCHTIAYEWWALSGKVTFCPELAYQYSVLQAAVQGATGGGVAWSFGPHPGGRWELGVRSFCVRLGEMVKKAGPSLFGTRPGKAFITKDGTPLIGLNFAATESADGKKTYVHLFKPPKGATFKLPLPADGRHFTSARILNGRHKIRINQSESGIVLTVKSPGRWDDVDTIIELH